MQSWLEGRIWVEKGAQATLMTASLRILSSKVIQTLGRASQGVNWSWSQCIKSHHAQTSSGKRLPSHFWNRNIVRSILPGLKRKRTGLLLSGPKSSFQIKVNFAFNLEIKVWSLEEDWRGTESKLLEVQCEVSEVSDDLGCHDVCCWCWSVVFYQVQSQCSHLPGDFGALYASICWQALWRCWFPCWSLPCHTSLMLEFVLKEPRPIIECINEHTLKNLNFSVLQIFFFIDLRKYSNILRYWFLTFMSCKL